MAGVKKYKFDVPYTKQGFIDELVKMYPKESKARLEHTKIEHLKKRFISSMLAIKN